MLIISSLQNPRVKDTVKLRDRRQRDESGRSVVDGAREIRLALRANIELEALFVCGELCHTVEGQLLLDQLDELGDVVCHVTKPVFEKLAFGDRAEGFLAVIKTPATELASWQLPPQPLVVVLESIEKPGNIGAILRSADAAGVSGLIVTGSGTDLYNPNTIRASLGTIFTQRVASATAANSLAWLREHGFRMFAARVEAVDLYCDADLRGPTAIILGSEAAGLTKHWHAPDITPIKLPMLGLADSLNVAATAAVVCYEAWRQRQNSS